MDAKWSAMPRRSRPIRRQSAAGSTAASVASVVRESDGSKSVAGSGVEARWLSSTRSSSSEKKLVALAADDGAGLR